MIFKNYKHIKEQKRFTFSSGYGYIYLCLFILFASIFNSTIVIAQHALDQLEYNYNTNTNQLNSISDGVSSAISTIDIDNQSSGNYEYDFNGQLTNDQAEGILEITWTTSGKVKKISFDDSEPFDGTVDRTIEFKYDAVGNRVKQIETIGSTTNTTYYIRNGNGDLISIYEDNGSGINRVETKIAVGVDRISSPSSVSTSLFERKIGYKNFELIDHLKSLRTSISDVKNPISGKTTFSANIEQASDYYCFGMLMPGRDQNSSEFRNGFQGMEKENDVKDNGNSYTTYFRQYDPRIGRWNSMDPKLYNGSPFVAFANNPIIHTDPKGDTSMVFTLDYGYRNQGDYEGEGENRPDYNLVSASNPVLTNLDQKGVEIIVVNHQNEFVARFAFNDPRDVGSRKKPDGTPIDDIDIIYLNGNTIIDQQLKYLKTTNAEGEEMSFTERWEYAYEEGQMGTLDFSRIKSINELTVVDGIAYNNYDFGNLIWGAAMAKLGFTDFSLWLGSNGNAFANEKQQNAIPFEGDDKPYDWKSWDRYTWRGSWSAPLQFDEKYDQQAISNGSQYYHKSIGYQRNCSVKKEYKPDK